MKRSLSVKFERAVSGSKPETVEVVVTPLNWANDPAADVTLVASKQVQKLRLANSVNVATFELTPSYDPGLDRPILYRIAWRKGFTGRIVETDFAMPDRDVDFDDLAELGNVITGENYLTEADLGVAGRVARLNTAGQVTDANGNAVVIPPPDETLLGAIQQEIRDRQSADATVRRDLTLRLETQVDSLSNTMNTRFQNEATARTNAIAAEADARNTQVQNTHTELHGHIDALAGTVTALDGRVAANTTALGTKADLVNGKIPTAQIPAVALGTSVAVADQASMLALTTEQVQPGDVAVRPDGTFMLLDPDPSDPDSWTQLVGMARVESVNGQTGAIVLSATDVGARPADVAISQSDVTGLVTALAGKASTTSVTSLDTRLTGRINTTDGNVTALTTRVGTVETSLTTLDGAAVKKDAAGKVPTALLGDDVPRVDADNVLRRSDGTIIAVSGGGGGTGGAVDSVNGKVGTVVLTASDVNARPANVLVPMADVDGLTTALAGKASTTDLQSTNTRVSRAETDIDDIQAQLAAGGSGGEVSSSKTSVTWVADSPTSPSLVTMRSPFGISPDGSPYYDPEGALEGEAAYPYVSMYGNLVLRKLDPNAPPEPTWATMGDINDLDARIDTLEAAPQGGYSPPEGGIPIVDLEAAAQTALTEVQAATSNASGDTLVERNAAGTFSVTAPTAATHPTTKQYVDDGLAAKANSSTVTTLTNTVNTKANQTDLTALTTRVTNTENALPLKADLDSSSLVPVTQIPTLPGTKITGFNLKADLDGAGGKLLLAQVPTGIPQANIANLGTTLAAKADLVGGKIPNAQIPALATNEVQTVANRAALLALNSTQVQRGDIGVITGTSDQGSYILNADDPSVWGNWVLLRTPSGTVSSVNGQTGIVVLSAADVNARPTGVAIPQADITNLTTDLAARATTTYVDNQVATRTTPAAVNTQIAGSVPTKHRVDYVATTAVSLSGSQSIDGVLVGANKRVLLTAQASSVQNGIWVVQTGAWTRAADLPDGALFLPGTMVAVDAGATHAQSLWQLTTTASGTVGTNQQAWSKSLQGGQKTYTQGDGVIIDANGKISAKGYSGIIVDTGGIRLDTSFVPRMVERDVPSGNVIATIQHDLNTRNVMVEIFEVASGNTVLVGVTRSSDNAVTAEFGSAPAAGQYKALIMGRGV